jgi:PAS domain S-box-containing protein
MYGSPGDERIPLSAVTAMPWSVAIFDRDMRYLAHSKSWLETHGVPGDRNLVGLLHAEVFAQLSDEDREVYRRGLELGEITRHEQEVFARADGGKEILRTLVTPWRDAAGAIHGLVVCVENITEQVETRRRLHEHDALIRDLFDKAPIGLNLCRLDGLWVESNPAFLELIGYSREEAAALTYWQVTPRAYDDAERAQLEQLRAERRYGPYEKEFIHKSGRHIPVRLNGFLVEREGETYIWSLIEDLTAQRELELEVEHERIKAIQTAKLATLGELAASIAHEINNPLQVIEAYAYVIGAMIERGQLRDASAGLTAIREATARAATIVAGLKRYARKAAIEPELFDLARLVDDTVALWRLRIRAEPIETQVSLASVSITGRPVEIGQVVFNLLNNAFDAARTSERPLVRIAVVAEPTRARIIIEDSGPRIPDAIADEMFRAFFTTKTSEGTGLGLSISREIIERHAGTIELDRTAPVTRFVVELPRGEA